MLYTEDFSMRHYVGFSQIGSHIASLLLCVYMAVIASKMTTTQHVVLCSEVLCKVLYVCM